MRLPGGHQSRGRTRRRAPINRRYASKDGGNHRRLSNILGLLQFADCIPTGDSTEHQRGRDQFHECGRVYLFQPQGQDAGNGLNGSVTLEENAGTKFAFAEKGLMVSGGSVVMRMKPLEATLTGRGNIWTGGTSRQAWGKTKNKPEHV